MGGSAPSGSLRGWEGFPTGRELEFPVWEVLQNMEVAREVGVVEVAASEM